MEKTRRLILLAALMTAAGCGSSVHTATFANAAEAREAGAMADGRVPDILPAAAFELRAAYDVDGPRRWGLFNFGPPQADELRSALTSDPLPFAGLDVDIPPRIEWWPVILRGPLDGERIDATGLQAYKTRTGGLIVAVNWKQGRAYYWRGSISNP